MRVGIFSGAFDPVHAGHVAFAQETMRTCGLEEVVFLPERVPRGKPEVTDITHRRELLHRATRSVPGLRTVELSARQFTVQDTLPELERMFAGSELTFLVGSDVVRTFLYRWPGLDILLAGVSLAIGMRQGDSPAEVATIMGQLERTYGLAVRYELVYTPHAGLASSKVRTGSLSETVLHPEVSEYIKRCGLYGVQA